MGILAGEFFMAHGLSNLKQGRIAWRQVAAMLWEIFLVV